MTLKLILTVYLVGYVLLVVMLLKEYEARTKWKTLIVALTWPVVLIVAVWETVWWLVESITRRKGKNGKDTSDD